jgi:hypothetical protein
MQTNNSSMRLEVLADRLEGRVVVAAEGEDGPLEPAGPWEEKLAEQPPSKEEQLRTLMHQIRGKKPTVTQLMTVLHLHGLVDRVYTTRDFTKGTPPKNWSDETYGPKSMLYFYAKKDDEKLVQMMSVLRKMGIKFSNTWNNGNGLEIPVAYFRGHNWDE